MDANIKEKIEQNRKATYAAVRNADPDLYRRVVEIGHLATIEFGGADELTRAVAVESAAMGLVAQALGLVVGSRKL